MKEQIVRLSVLFATFVFAYILRFFYQLGRGTDIYLDMCPNMVVRWSILLALPVVWDISSILAILILHYKSFKHAKCSAGLQAGHFNKQAGLPPLDTETRYSDFDSSII